MTEDLFAAAPSRPRRRLLVIGAAFVVAVLTVVAGLAAAASLAVAPVNVAGTSFASNQVDPCWVFPFYLDQKGTLHGSWNSFPPTSSALFVGGQYHAGTANCTSPARWGNPLWVGQSSASNDSFAVQVAAGQYDLLFVGAPNGSDVKGTGLTLDPDPPAWWPWA
jgi:hypothetical protein